MVLSGGAAGVSIVYLSWCLDPESNRDAPFQEAADFKSAVSTYFTIEALQAL
jgi:hypothetical protein